MPGTRPSWAAGVKTQRNETAARYKQAALTLDEARADAAAQGWYIECVKPWHYRLVGPRRLWELNLYIKTGLTYGTRGAPWVPECSPDLRENVREAVAAFDGLRARRKQRAEDAAFERAVREFCPGGVLGD